MSRNTKGAKKKRSGRTGNRNFNFKENESSGKIKLIQLHNVLDETRSGFASGKRDPNGVIQLRMNNVSTDGSLNFDKITRVPATKEQIDRTSLFEGDVLFNCTNSPELVGKTCFFPGNEEPVVFSNHFLRLRSNPNVLDSRYLARWLICLRNRGLFTHGCIRWVNQATFRKEDLLDLKIPLPPLAEQKRIAGILDAADELRAKRRESLAQLDALLQSTFLDMFGDPVTNPMGWETKELAEVVRTGTIVTYGIVQAGPEYIGGVPYIRTGDIVDNEIRIESLRHTDPAIAAKFGRSCVKAGELVISIRATVGTTAVVPPEINGANLTQGTARIAPGRQTETSYLLYFLRSQGCQLWIERQVKGATFREITLKRLRQLPVYLPPLNLQRRFASIVESVEQQKTLMRNHLAELDTLFSSLQSRAFNGEL